jgi:Tol biopolymer transport system component
MLPVDGGEAWQLTKAPAGVQQFAWSPDGSHIAFVSPDELPKVTGPERHNKAFEVQNNDFLRTTAPMPNHLWLIPADGGQARRVTSGTWTLPASLPPSSPSSPPSWSPDGKSIAIVKVATPYTGDANWSAVQILNLADGSMRPLTGGDRNETQPLVSPDGRQVTYWRPRDGAARNVNEIHMAPIGGGVGRSLTRAIDRNVQRSIWMPDGKSLLVNANDGTSVSLWIQPVDGEARRIHTRNVTATTGSGWTHPWGLPARSRSQGASRGGLPSCT